MINWWITNHPNVYFWGLERGLDFLLVPALFCNKSRIIKDDALSFMKDGSSSVLFSVVSLHSLTLSLMVGPHRLWSLSSLESFVDPEEHATNTMVFKKGDQKPQDKQQATLATKRSLLGNNNSKSYIFTLVFSHKRKIRLFCNQGSWPIFRTIAK